jgi:hypothetical protein
VSDDRPARAAFKSVAIDRDVESVVAFLADVTNWPRWAVVNVLAVEPSREPGWWSVATPDGPAELRLRADLSSGIVDHDFRVDADDIATVPARVVANGRGAEFTMTIFQPAGLTDEEFDSFLATVDVELSTLREVLEAR